MLADPRREASSGRSPAGEKLCKSLFTVDLVVNVRAVLV
jgi:hypothetical protein